MAFHPEVRGSNRRALGGLASVLVGGSILVGLSGCVSPEQELAEGKITRAEYDARKQQTEAQQAMLFGGILSGLGATRDNPGAVALGESMSRYGAARAGQANVQQRVQVYGNPNASNLTAFGSGDVTGKVESIDLTNDPANGPRSFRDIRFGEIISATFNYCLDTNNNGFLEWPEDYSGVKDFFAVGEKITTRMGSRVLIPGLSYKLVDETGKVIDEVPALTRDFYGVERTYNSGEATSKTLNAGVYEAAWYANGSLVAERKFTVGRNESNK